MEYVLLDTCVLVNCTLVNASDADPELLVTIFEKMRDKGTQLLLPQVIESEYIRKVPEELEFIKQQTKKFRNAITTQVLTAPDVSRLHSTLDKLNSDRHAAVSRAQGYFNNIVADMEFTVRIPLDGESVAEAVGYVLAGRKPSRGPAKGLLDPDSLIIASVARFARAKSLSEEDTILICSDNHKDFAVWDSQKDKHVISGDIADTLPCSIRYYKSPRSLVEEELDVLLESDEPLSIALDEYDKLSKTIASITAATQLADIHKSWEAISRTINPDIIKNWEAISRTINPDIFKSWETINRTINSDIIKNWEAISRMINPDIFKSWWTLPQHDVDKPLDEDSNTEEDNGQDEPPYDQ